MTAATPAQPAPASPHLGCAVCASGVTTPHGAGGTPGQAVDPSTTAYRVHAYAFNTLTERLAADDQFVPLSVRDAIASAIVAAVEPLIRADDAEQVRLAREDRDQLRKQVLDLAGELDGRCATRPPGQSHTEHEIAVALRKIAEPPS